MWICIKIRTLPISYQRYNKHAKYLNKYNDVRVLLVAIVSVKETLRELAETVGYIFEIFSCCATVLQQHYHVHILTQ